MQDDASTIENAEPTPDAIIELPKTRLSVRGNEFIKTSKHGSIIGKLSLSDIQDVKVEHVIDPFGAVFCAIGLVSAVVCKRYIGSELWSWLTAVVMLIFTAFCFAGLRKQRLLVITCGERVPYDVLDSSEDGWSFAMSLKQLALKHRGEKNVVM